MKNLSNVIKWAIVIGFIIAFYILLIPKGCNNNNPIVTDPTTGMPVKEIPINDSDVIYKQLLYKAQYEKQLVIDSFARILINSGKISPETVIKWRDNYIGQEKSILLQDSLNRVIGRIGVIQNELMLTQELTLSEREKLQKEKAELLAIRIPFKDSSMYRHLQGNIGFNGQLNITKDEVKSEPYVVFGSKKKVINIGDPTYTVVLGNKNPRITSDSIFSITYKPKPKIELSVGPMILANQKSITAGFGFNAKRGKLSLSLGYTLINNNFK